MKTLTYMTILLALGTYLACSDPAYGAPAEEFERIHDIFSDQCGFARHPTLAKQVQCAEEIYVKESPAGTAVQLFDALGKQEIDDMRSRRITDYDARLEFQQTLRRTEKNLGAGYSYDVTKLPPLRLTYKQSTIADAARKCLIGSYSFGMQRTCVHSTLASSQEDVFHSIDDLAQALLQDVHEKRLTDDDARANLVLAFNALPPAPEDSGSSSTESGPMQSVYDKVTSDAVARYEIAERTGTPMDVCVQAGFVKAAYLQAKDEQGYGRWKDIEATDCEEAGVRTSK